MATTTPSEQLNVWGKGRVWKQWGKLVTGSQDVDLAKANGYSLTGKFVQWEQTVAVGEGQFLICAAEIGKPSRKHYAYEIVTCRNGELVRVSDEEIEDALEMAGLPDEQLAKIANSWLYKAASYCALQFSGATPTVPLAHISTEQLIEALEARGYESRKADPPMDAEAIARLNAIVNCTA